MKSLKLKHDESEENRICICTMVWFRVLQFQLPCHSNKQYTAIMYLSIIKHGCWYAHYVTIYFHMYVHIYLFPMQLGNYNKVKLLTKEVIITVSLYNNAPFINKYRVHFSYRPLWMAMRRVTPQCRVGWSRIIICTMVRMNLREINLPWGWHPTPVRNKAWQTPQ